MTNVFDIATGLPATPAEAEAPWNALTHMSRVGPGQHTQDDALAAMECLRRAASLLSAMPMPLLDSVAISTRADGPMDACRLADIVSYDLRLLQAAIKNHRSAHCPATTLKE